MLLAAPASRLLALAAVLVALTTWPVGASALRPRTPGAVTAADALTLLRLLGAGALAAGTALVLGGELAARSWPLAALNATALATDTLDGPVARRTGSAGPIGARIDMEADAALVMVPSVLVATVVGPWALAIGLMRYAFVAAPWMRPALREPLTFSQFPRRRDGRLRMSLQNPPAGYALMGGIILTTLITAIVHLSFGIPLFVLNGLGYLGLLVLL